MIAQLFRSLDTMTEDDLLAAYAHLYEAELPTMPQIARFQRLTEELKRRGYMQIDESKWVKEASAK